MLSKRVVEAKSVPTFIGACTYSLSPVALLLILVQLLGFFSGGVGCEHQLLPVVSKQKRADVFGRNHAECLPKWNFRFQGN